MIFVFHKMPHSLSRMAAVHRSHGLPIMIGMRLPQQQQEQQQQQRSMSSSFFLGRCGNNHISSRSRSAAPSVSSSSFLPSTMTSMTNSTNWTTTTVAGTTTTMNHKPLFSFWSGTRCLSSSSHTDSGVFELADLSAVNKFMKDEPKAILYFTATWCGPCRQIKPIYEEMSTKFKDIAFGLVDVDDNPDTAAEYEIRSVPTFIFLDKSQTVNRFSGAAPDQLESMAKDLQSR